MEISKVNFRSVCIAIVIVKKGNKFLCINETDRGWYLPAGRVDLGETFANGAIREAVEETGVPVKLEGLLQLQHRPDDSTSRLRCIFYATPVDDTPPLSTPTHEVLEAKWLTLDEVLQIPTNKLRSSELPKLLQDFHRGILQVHPLSVLEGRNIDDLIDHEKAVTDMWYKCKVIVRSKNKFCFTKQENSWKIPSKIMERQRMFSRFAEAIHLQEILFPAVETKVTPMGIIKIKHVPCESLSVTFVAEVAQIVETEQIKWLTLEEYASLEGFSEVDLKILQESMNVYIAPVGLMSLE